VFKKKIHINISSRVCTMPIPPTPKSALFSSLY
jgi:hypothetical protein